MRSCSSLFSHAILMLYKAAIALDQGASSLFPGVNVASEHDARRENRKAPQNVDEATAGIIQASIQAPGGLQRSGSSCDVRAYDLVICHQEGTAEWL